MSSVPSATKAKESAQKIFTIIDEPSSLDVREKEGKLTQFKEGAIELKNLSFNYPSRKAKVLKNFSLSIPAGKKIGLVGHSGCGKSTITNLLLRFYNIQEGQILIDGKSIDEYDIQEMRRQIGYVMQEPVLFNMSIKDNILYG
jgi:ABC-type iron transport system FetAB ATPase subunit